MGGCRINAVAPVLFSRVLKAIRPECSPDRGLCMKDNSSREHALYEPWHKGNLPGIMLDRTRGIIYASRHLDNNISVSLPNIGMRHLHFMGRGK